MAGVQVDDDDGRPSWSRRAKLARRCRECGRWSVALLRQGDAGTAPAGRSMPVGCRLRVCAECNAARRGVYDRRFRSQFQGLQADGHRILFVTLTRKVIPGIRLRHGVQDVRAGLRKLRHGRAARKWWGGIVAGGIYGLEGTLYRRDKSGEIIIDSNTGELARRVHAHVHLVLALQRGVDAEAAGASIVRAWVDACRALGWYAEEIAQDVQEVDGSALADADNPAGYVVKYIGKPADILDLYDAEEVLEGCRGLRQVQALGCLHGRALQRTRDRVAGLPLPDELAGRQWEADGAAEASATFRAAAVDAVAGNDDGAAWQWLGRARELRRAHEQAAADVWRARTGQWAGSLADAAAAEAAAKLDAARVARLHAAREAVARRTRWLEVCETRCLRDDGAAVVTEAAARRRQRADEAADRLVDAEAWLARCEAWAEVKAQPDDGGRARVLALRSAQAAESARWYAAARGDLADRETVDAVRAAGDGDEADAYRGTAYALRGRAAAAESADAAAARAQERLQAARAVRSANLNETRRQRSGGRRASRHAKDEAKTAQVDADNVQRFLAEYQEALAEAVEARARLVELAERLPVTVAVLERVATPAAAATMAAVRGGDEAREAARAQRAAERAKAHGAAQLDRRQVDGRQGALFAA